MAQTQSPNVLVIDDEPELRELLTDTLAAEGVRVAVAGSAAEALARAETARPDLLVADVRLPDGSGLDALDRLRRLHGTIPAVVITGFGDPALSESVYRRRSVEFMTKPLDLPRLRHAVRRELTRLDRVEKRRRLTRELNRDRRALKQQINGSCSALTAAYQGLSRQMQRQEELIRFQQFLLGCTCTDEVFRGLFRFFVDRGGPVFGLALVCDARAELQLVGRFGVPAPDGLRRCQMVASGLIDVTLEDPRVSRIEADVCPGLFDPELLETMPGSTFLTIPLLPAPGRMIGLAVLYRKGEQPFEDEEVALAEMIAPALSLTVQNLADVDPIDPDA